MPRETATPKPYLSIPEAARLLGIHPTTALNRAKTLGHLNGVRVVPATPTRLVVSRAALERAIAGEIDQPVAAPLPWDRVIS